MNAIIAVIAAAEYTLSRGAKSEYESVDLHRFYTTYTSRREKEMISLPFISNCSYGGIVPQMAQMLLSPPFRIFILLNTKSGFCSRKWTFTL